MNHRTSLFVLFLAAALSTGAAFAQDATTDASQQAMPVSSTTVQSTSTDANTATDQGQTSGDASGMATTATSTSAYDSSQTGDQDQKDEDAQSKP